jgi:amino-acid N-acetyltransferase
MSEPDGYFKIRRANVKDAKAIHTLLMDHSRDGKVIPRSLNEIFEKIRSFFVMEAEGKIAGCCCLHVMWEDLAEIKSLAVAPDHQGNGLGAVLVKQALAEAEELKVARVFALTLIPEFFEKFGFGRIDMNELPKKIWMECVNCIYYPDCREVAVIREV